MSFFEELKRRNVFRVGIAYLFGAWLLAQISELILETFNAPDWTMQFIVVLLLIGFPIALFFAWAFEMTPEGIKKEIDVDRSALVTPQTAGKLNNVILILAILAAGYFFWESRFKSLPTETTPQQSNTVASSVAQSKVVTEQGDEVTIAVLPFVNMSSDPEQEYFSDGITEEILNVLARIDGLRVTSRSSAFSLKGQNLDIPTVAERLGVAHVLEGSVRKAGNQVRVTAQLIRVSDDSHLWSQTYDRELDNIFAIQDEISTAIAGALQVELGPDRESYQAPTSNLQAYELYLRGRELQSTRNVANLVSSMDLFQQALDLDPGFNDALGQMAMSALLLGSRRDVEDVGVGNEEAERLARKTLEKDPGNGLALIVLAEIANDRWEWSESAKLLEQAQLGQGSEATIEYWNGLFWLQTGYSEKALEFFKAANTKDPLNANIWRWLSNAYDAIGEYEKAVEYMEKAVRVGQGFSHSVAESLLAAGQEDRARAYLDEYSTGAEGEAAASELILNGNPEPALTQLEPDDHESRAWILQQAGRHREAMESLRLVNDGGQVTRVQIHMANNFWGPESARFRQSPEFKAFIKDFGLFDFWHEAGFPPLCRPVGKEDFECD